MRVTLLESNVYDPGPGLCIYCWPLRTNKDDLTREHIIARKLGGTLILRNASCVQCAKQINMEIETPTLTWSLTAPRTHLKLPTSKPRTTLPMARWNSNDPMLKDMPLFSFMPSSAAVPGSAYLLTLPSGTETLLAWELDSIKSLSPITHLEYCCQSSLRLEFFGISQKVNLSISPKLLRTLKKNQFQALD